LLAAIDGEAHEASSSGRKTMNEPLNTLPTTLTERLRERDRILAEAHLARAEALVDLMFAAGRGLKRLGAAIARPWTDGFDAQTRERTRQWPHPQAR
jgi:hypothetical protein